MVQCCGTNKSSVGLVLFLGQHHFLVIAQAHGSGHKEAGQLLGVTAVTLLSKLGLERYIPIFRAEEISFDSFTSFTGDAPFPSSCVLRLMIAHVKLWMHCLRILTN